MKLSELRHQWVANCTHEAAGQYIGGLEDRIIILEEQLAYAQQGIALMRDKWTPPDELMEVLAEKDKEIETLRAIIDNMITADDE